MGKGRKTLVLVIAKLRKKYTLKALLNYTKLAKSTYYDALKKLSREDKYKGLKTLIHNICNKNHGRYGYRRVTMHLHKQGIKINHKVVMRLMKEENLTCKVRAKKYKSYRGQEGKIAKNILNRNFKAEKPNEKWATDVTEFALCNEKIYLSPIIDLYNGEIISYKISKRPILKQVLDMVEDATKKIKETKGIILHSDQGWQYQNKRYQKLLKEKGIIQSMSRKGNCLDNAVIENFFGLLKSELFYLKKFKSVEDFIKELLEEQDEAIEIQRNELAEHFNCVPSQINYVISTRFKPSQGYYVESKRGGGGHITIKKVNNSKEDYIMHIINNVGKELTANEVDILISDFLSYDIINKKEARLLKVATSDNVLQLQKDLKDKVRARIFKNMLLNLE